MSAFDEKENEILPSLDVGQRKRPSILKSVGNAVLPLNKKKKLFFSTIQYQEVFADGTCRTFYQSINDISASESVVEPSKIFPNDDMDEDSSGDDLLNKTKFLSNDDLSLDSQSDSIPKIVVNSQPSQPSQPQSELMSMTLIDPVPVGNESMVSVSQSESTHKEITEEIANQMKQTSLDISSTKLSYHKSSSPFVKISHTIPECEMLPSHHMLDLSGVATDGGDETSLSYRTTLPFNRPSQTGPVPYYNSCVWNYFGKALTIHIQFRPIARTVDKIIQFSWVLGFKNGAPFVSMSHSRKVVVERESKILIIIEKFINTELSSVEKSLDSIASKSELFCKVNKILKRIAILTKELLDLWQRYDGKLLSVSENSFRCGFNIDRLKKRALLVIHLDLQKYLNQKLSVHLRAHFDDRLFYTPITRKILECCQAIDPSVNRGSYLRRVVKSAENFISDYRKQEDRIRCACYHSEKLRAIISAPMPDIDRATLVEKVVEVLASSYNVPLYSNDLNFRRKIRHNSRKNVEKPEKQSS